MVAKGTSDKVRRTSLLKKGDSVIVIAGGNSKKNKDKGKVGRILRFVGTDRVVVEGVAYLVKHQRQTGPNKPSGKITKEGSVHISNVMYYVETLKKAVRLKVSVLDDGTKARGYVSPETKRFIQV